MCYEKQIIGYETKQEQAQQRFSQLRLSNLNQLYVSVPL